MTQDIVRSDRQWEKEFNLFYTDVVDVAGGCWRDWEGGFGRKPIASDILHPSLRARQRELSEAWRTGATSLPQSQRPMHYAPPPSVPWGYQTPPAQPHPAPPLVSTETQASSRAEPPFPLHHQNTQPTQALPNIWSAQNQPSSYRLISAATWQHPTVAPRAHNTYELPGNGPRSGSAAPRSRDISAGGCNEENATSFGSNNPFRRQTTMQENGRSHPTRRRPDQDKIARTSSDRSRDINHSAEPDFSLRPRSKTEAPRSGGRASAVYSSDIEEEDEDEVKVERRIPGFLWPEDQEPIGVLAYPDDGAHLNGMSYKFALDKGFNVRTDPQHRMTVQLPNGQSLTSVGQTYSDFIFSREPGNVHHEWFAVFDVDSRMGLSDVILGSILLDRTRTLTEHSHRISTVEVTRGVERIQKPDGTKAKAKKRLHGYLNGELVKAMPDGMSVVNLMSEAYAQRRGFTIYEVSGSADSLEFYDGSTQQITGEVHADWTFEDAPDAQPIRLKFRVYSRCPHKVLLGQPLLFNTALDQSAYRAHATSFHNSESSEGVFDLGPIMWSRKKAAHATTSPPPQTSSVRERSDELDRRIRAEKEYMELTGQARRDAEDRERLRRWEWDNLHPPLQGTTSP